MQKYSFATVISYDGERAVASHLPVLVTQEKGEIVLLSHLAKANKHAEVLKNGPVLTIFSQPHAYISPRFYEKAEDVPTWNYIAVHAYGKAVLVNDEKGKLKLLEKTILNYEPEYLSQWNGLSEDLKIKMLKGIAAFKIPVTELEAKNK